MLEGVNSRRSFMVKLCWSALLLCILDLVLSRAFALSGPNVCTKYETYTTMVNTSYSIAIPVKTYTFCYSIPPKCSKFKITYKNKYQPRPQSMVRTIDICCKGYILVPEEDRCQPICSQQCIHGVCVKPEECLCEDGYTGESCNLTNTIDNDTLIIIPFADEDPPSESVIFVSKAVSIAEIQSLPPCDSNDFLNYWANCSRQSCRKNHCLSEPCPPICLTAAIWRCVAQLCGGTTIC